MSRAVGVSSMKDCGLSAAKNERPRSYLDARNVVPVSSLNFRTSGYGQTVSYLNLPPYFGQRGRAAKPSYQKPHHPRA